MAVDLYMDPTMVNVLTDLILLVLQVAWVKLMAWLTALDLKRNLRKGNRLFSYEHWGTGEYLYFGLRKYRKLAKKSVLTSEERRQFMFHSCIAFSTVIFTLALLFLHILIDYGLDFRQIPQRTGTSAAYDMVGFSPNSEYLTLLNQYQNLGEDLASCVNEGNSPEDCRDSVEEVSEFVREKLREGSSFVKQLYEASSLTQVDVIEEMEISYQCADLNSINDKLECNVTEETTDFFDGEFKYTPENAMHRKKQLRMIKLDMRAKQVVAERALVRKGVHTDELLNRLTGVKKDLSYVSFENFKDERQATTYITIERAEVDSFAKVEDKYNLARLTTNSGVVYNGNKQGIKFRQLTRSKLGVKGDEDFTLNTVVQTNVAWDEKSGVHCISPHFRSRRDGQKFEMELSYKGQMCGRYSITGNFDWCYGEDLAYEKKAPSEEEKPEERRFGRQRAFGVIVLTESDSCYDEVYTHYRPFMNDDVPADQRTFTIGMSFEVMCTPEEGGQTMTCAHGTTKLYYDGEKFLEEEPAEVSEEDQANGIRELKAIKAKAEISFHMAEIEGGDSSVNREVTANAKAIINEQYTELREFTDFRVMRGRLFGALGHFAFRDTIAAYSSQIAPVQRDVGTYELVNIAVLLDEYIGGFLAVVCITGVALLLVVYRYFVERYKYRYLNFHVKVPLTITEWIHTALNDDDRLTTGSGDLNQKLEYTGNPDTLRSHRGGSIVGFFNTPEALDKTKHIDE
uniref:Uncharacterized protein n=1 Tax=Rhodosorus marinus TaxID=101924 RepID=A0A7S0BQT2_9RHOD|mmetsp:Transcript_4397/g.6171  ORF Transcript_4397/g.6171 Transcript_4397/m.6171 type:complete len:739 (+) Transcript_4397:204-2420(+)|eukprot:CAMPEP_0184746028 /NCGR_PEP_ID=MMETSP0315-20130426/8611_1 /TAXON_ID=101924 /ORGANISM="Rhodosorus marinus, Strain UTEX LB 2760" /LENGTH=738 /DNA_ID=CAMNT_0027218411 /DNA_START=150 /DNA_END=2366 /DNA_ORIENTATION=+